MMASQRRFGCCAGKRLWEVVPGPDSCDPVWCAGNKPGVIIDIRRTGFTKGVPFIGNAQVCGSTPWVRAVNDISQKFLHDGRCFEEMTCSLLLSRLSRITFPS